MICELCDREIPEYQESKHHLVPVAAGGKHGPTALLHYICHATIHAHYDNKYLGKHLNTVELLRADETLAAFIAWVRKKPNDFYTPTKKSRKRR